MTMLCLWLNAQQPVIKPLVVGDTVPDLLIENVANYKSSQLSLASLKGKPLIIDFWGQFCAPCIKTILKLDSLKKSFNHSFEVITVSDHTSEEELRKTLSRYKTFEGFQLPVVLGASALKKYFPYKIISHLVWIDKEGVVKAITGGDEVTVSKLEEFVTGQPINWPIKNDVLNFNLRQPLLEYTKEFDNPPQQLYYSGFFSYLPRVHSASGYPFKDSVTGTQTISFFNLPLLHYCSYALGMSSVFATGQYVLNVRDSTRFVRPAGSDKNEWRALNTYCYTIRLPIHIEGKARTKIMQQDIQNWLLRLGIAIEKKEDDPKIYITEL